MAINFKKIWTGLTVVPKTATSADSKGELEVIDSTGKLQYHNGTSVSPVLTEAHSATITNKVIDADDNTISDLEVDNLKAGVLNTSTTLLGATDLQVPSALAVKTYVDSSSASVQADVDDLITLSGVPANSTNLGTFTGTTIPDASTVKSALQSLETFAETNAANLSAHLSDAVDAHDASAISNVPAGTILATDVQAAINELDGDVQTVQTNLTTHINDATDAHDASAISNVPSGNLAATDVQGALNELQTDVDTRATDAALSAHIADTTTHGTTGDIVGTTDTQTLTNKTITGASIQTPTRLDVKQDTKVNLETYALTATNGQLVFATDTKEMFQVVDAALVAVGAAGGDSDVDALIIQTFESAALTDFTQTGLILDTTSPLHGSISAKLIHQGAINQSFKQVIPVDQKFRGAAMTFAVTAKSTASAGNVTVLFRDETNAVDLQTTQQINAGATPQTFQFGVTIPSDCLSFSYTITALPEAGSPETFIDDIAIRNYWQGTALEGQTEYTFEVPVVTDWVDFTPTSSFNVNTTHTGKWRRIGSDIEVITQLSFSGAPNATSLVLVLPNSLNYDTTRFTANPQHTIVGTVAWQDIGVQNYTGWITPRLNTPTQVDVYYGTGSTLHSYGTSNNTTPFTIGSGDVLVAKYKLPISGWATTESKTVVITDLVPARSMPANASIEVPVIVENSYSAVLDGITAAIISTSKAGWITSSTDSGSGDCLINYSGLGLTTIPSIEATVQWSGGVKFAGIVDATTTTARLTSSTVTGTLTDPVKYNVTITKQGSDYTDPLTATETKTWSATQAAVTEESDSAIRLTGYTGLGGTANKVVRFTTLLESFGDAVTLSQSSVNGDTFTINKEGIYTMSFRFDSGVANTYFGITKNATSTTTFVTSDFLSFERSPSAANYTGSVSWSGKLAVGDVIRCQTDGGTSTNTANNGFSITYQGGLSLVQTVADQKIKIPTSELKFEGASTRGAVATGIVKFDTLAKIRGDAFTVTSTTNDGTYVTMTKEGKLSASVSLFYSGAGYIRLTKNLTNLTATPSVPSEVMGGAGAGGAGVAPVAMVSSTFDVKVGDIIRVFSSVAPTAEVLNSFTLSFQEQDIAVAVTNVLPQFSESDSSIRLDTGNGFGSTANKIRRFSNIRENLGLDILYSDSATDGSSFTVRTSGIYNISYSDYKGTAGASFFGVTKNASSLTTAIQSLATSEVLTISEANGSASGQGSCSWEGYLVSGDVLRAHSDGSLTGTTLTTLTISKVGKPNVTGVDVTPFVDIPLKESQSSLMASSASFGSATITGALTESSGGGIYTYNASTGIYTMLKAADITISATHGAAGAATVVPAIFINGVLKQYAYSVQSTNFRATTTHSQKINAGSTFYVANQTANTTNSQAISVLAVAESDSIVTPVETFSTDTASLTYASSSQYTLSTLANAPVGTYITFTYAASTNTRTQTTTRPTQTDVDMNTNGILLYGRSYANASTDAQPSTVAIQIGKGLKGVSKSIYQAVNKTLAGSLDFVVRDGNQTQHGPYFKDYNESTGIILVDFGLCAASTITTNTIWYVDGSTQSSGYMVINASKNPALTGVSSGIYAARAVNTSGTSIANTGDTKVALDASSTIATNMTVDSTNDRIYATTTGIHEVRAAIQFSSQLYAAGNAAELRLYKNGVYYSTLGRMLTEVAASQSIGVGGSDLISLATGDYVEIFANNNRTGGATPLSTSAGANFFCVNKIGGVN